MADNFGIKLGIDGEKAFKQALRDINANFKELGSEMKLVTSQFDKNDKSVEALAARNTVLTKTITEQQNKINTLRDALKNAEESFGANDKRTQQWRIQLNNAEAELNNMQRELQETTEDLKENNEESEKSEKNWSALSKTAKIAGATIAAAWAAVSAAAVKAGKALVQMTLDGAKYADEVMTQSEVTGIATDKLQEYMYAAELVDVSTETLTGALTKTIKSMSSAANGTGDAATAYAKLGVSVTNANGELRDNEEVFWDVLDALSGIDNETERDAIAMKLLGKSAQELNPLIKAGSDRMRELGEEARNTGYVLSDDTLAAYGKLDDSMQRIKNSATAAKNALGTILLPALEKLASAGATSLGKLSKALNEANGDMSKLGDAIEEGLSDILGAIADIIPELLQVITSAVNAALDALLDNADEIISTVLDVLGQVLQSLIKSLPKVTSAVITLIKGIIRTIAENAGDIVKAVVESIALVLTEIGDSLPEIVGLVIDIIDAIVVTLIENIDTLLEGVLKIINGILQAIVQNIPRLITLIGDVVMAIVREIPSIIKTLVSNLGTIITSLLNAILDSLPDLIGAILQLAADLSKEGPAIVAELIKMIPDIIKGFIKELLDPENLFKFIEAGGELIASLGEGIWNGIKSIGEGIINFFKGIWEAIKSIFSGDDDDVVDIVGDGIAGATGPNSSSGSGVVRWGNQSNSPVSRVRTVDNSSSGETPVNPNAYGGITVNIENYVQNTGEDVDDLADRVMTAAERRQQRVVAMTV